jgi:hypothetical protein
MPLFRVVCAVFACRGGIRVAFISDVITWRWRVESAGFCDGGVLCPISPNIGAEQVGAACEPCAVGACLRT